MSQRALKKKKRHMHEQVHEKKNLGCTNQRNANQNHNHIPSHSRMAIIEKKKKCW